MKNVLNKVAAIHDLSGIGRCSLTVIIPILSAMGIQVCPVPTAVLSAHTGFADSEIKDLTDYIPRALGHYKRLGEEFDCVYSGFLASNEQIDYCLDFFASFPDALKVVDPVMGDNGKPYRTYTKELCARMGELVAIADIITPNTTEAAMLLGENPLQTVFTAQQAKSFLARLAEKGPKTVVITSVELADGTRCNVGFDKERSSFWKVPYQYVPASYNGTGDAFASVLIGAILKGDSLPIAMNRATGFLELAVKTTYSYSSDPRCGVMLEACLSWLIQNPTLCSYQPL